MILESDEWRRRGLASGMLVDNEVCRGGMARLTIMWVCVLFGTMIKVQKQKVAKAVNSIKATRALRTPKATESRVIKSIVPTRRSARTSANVSDGGDIENKKRNDAVYKSQMKLADSIVSRYSDVFRELAK